MRVAADTNIIVSGLLWHGAPRQTLDAARDGLIDLFTSAVLLAELEDVLGRRKFAERLKSSQVTARELVLGYAALVTLVAPGPIPSVILEDPEDDAVLACAIAAQAQIIVTGDTHLLQFKEYEGIPIRTAAELLAQLASR
jgi:putative PIN family toxin of toxin-antitoxin system